MTTRKKRGGSGIHYFHDENISVDPNMSPNYKSIGIITATSVQPINALRKIGTTWANIIGSKGFEMSVYDNLRMDVLEKIKSIMKGNQIDKITSLRFDFIENPSNITVSCYGTALKQLR